MVNPRIEKKTSSCIVLEAMHIEAYKAFLLSEQTLGEVSWIEYIKIWQYFFGVVFYWHFPVTQ
jgi:hypothetical protein